MAPVDLENPTTPAPQDTETDLAQAIDAAEDLAGSVDDGLRAGLDIEMHMPRYYGKKLRKHVLDGEVPEKDINDAVLRILRQKDRFSRVLEKKRYEKREIAGERHTRLALEAARKSIVLLKNEKGVLPLDRGSMKSVAVIGERADKADLGDMGSSRVRPPHAVSPLKGIRDRAGKNVKVLYSSGKKLSEATELARNADAVVVFAGLSWREEGEFLPIPLFKLGGDRLSLDLPEKQEKLIQAVAAENGRCVVMLRGGSAITMTSWEDRVPAILMAWYPGMEGGNAVADIIFGDVNPSGRLPSTFPKSMDQLPFFGNRVKEIAYGYYHGYRHLDRADLEPAFPFGFGLSYTKFEYLNLKLDRKTLNRGGTITVRVDVANVGAIAGEEVVQIYVGCRSSRVDRPVKDLKAFGRLSLAPGETGTLEREICAADLAYYDLATKSWVVEETEYVVYAGSSAAKKDLHLSDIFRIEGP